MKLVLRTEAVVRWWTLWASLPAAWLVLFYGFVLRARLSLGFWPKPYHPDPKDLGFDVHHQLILVTLCLALTSPVAVGLLYRRFAITWGSPRGARMRFIAFAIAYGAMLLVASLDPERLLEWFMD